MDQDYLLIGVDLQAKVALRFLSLPSVVEESLKIHPLKDKRLEQVYVRFLLASALIGSRMDDQESILFKLAIEDGAFYMNCEVAPGGQMRSAIFPVDKLPEFSGVLEGILQVNRLKKDSKVYQSLTQIRTDSVARVFRDYLQNSDQSDSLFFLHSDEDNYQNNFGLWIERLPGTTEQEWKEWQDRFSDPDFFHKVVVSSDDPDVIIQKLFPGKMRILTVTKPQLSCDCTKDKIIDALTTLSNEDLVEIFMEGTGVETRCDYCGKIWQVKDEDIKHLVTGNSSVH